MERLTRKSDSGMVWFIDREHESEYIEREPCEMDAHHARLAIAKLAEYEDMEEQGKLLKLPCAVGDWIYKLKDGWVNSHKVVKMEVEESGVYFKSSLDPEAWPFCTLDDFGKTVFLTREEAEAALERQGKDREYECKRNRKNDSRSTGE